MKFTKTVFTIKQLFNLSGFIVNFDNTTIITTRFVILTLLMIFICIITDQNLLSEQVYSEKTYYAADYNIYIIQINNEKKMLKMLKYLKGDIVRVCIHETMKIL